MGQTLLFLVLLRLLAGVAVAVAVLAVLVVTLVVLGAAELHKTRVPVFRVGQEQVVREIPAVKAVQEVDSPAVVAVVGEQRVERHRGMIRVMVVVETLRL
jgi:hypothetical protein